MKRLSVPLFLLLFFVYAAPFSRAMFHSLVHEHGTPHSHEHVPTDHSQQDHNSGEAQDLQLANVSFTADCGPRSQAQLQQTVIAPIVIDAFASLPDPEPPLLEFRRSPDDLRRGLSFSHLLSSPLRAPPSV